MYDREEEILNYFVNRSTNASAESLNAKIKDFWAQLRGVITRNSSSSDGSRFSVNPRGYAGDPLKIAFFCHLLMLIQIIFVILCPKYDNLKQGKPTLIYMTI